MGDPFTVEELEAELERQLDDVELSELDDEPDTGIQSIQDDVEAKKGLTHGVQPIDEPESHQKTAWDAFLNSHTENHEIFVETFDLHVKEAQCAIDHSDKLMEKTPETKTHGKPLNEDTTTVSSSLNQGEGKKCKSTHMDDEQLSFCPDHCEPSCTFPCSLGDNHHCRVNALESGGSKCKYFQYALQEKQKVEQRRLQLDQQAMEYAHAQLRALGGTLSEGRECFSTSPTKCDTLCSAKGEPKFIPHDSADELDLVKDDKSNEDDEKNMTHVNSGTVELVKSTSTNDVVALDSTPITEATGSPASVMLEVEPKPVSLQNQNTTRVELRSSALENQWLSETMERSNLLDIDLQIMKAEQITQQVADVEGPAQEMKEGKNITSSNNIMREIIFGVKPNSPNEQQNDSISGSEGFCKRLLNDERSMNMVRMLEEDELSLKVREIERVNLERQKKEEIKLAKKQKRQKQKRKFFTWIHSFVSWTDKEQQSKQSRLQEEASNLEQMRFEERYSRLFSKQNNRKLSLSLRAFRIGVALSSKERIAKEQLRREELDRRGMQVAEQESLEFHLRYSFFTRLINGLNVMSETTVKAQTFTSWLHWSDKKRQEDDKIERNKALETLVITIARFQDRNLLIRRLIHWRQIKNDAKREEMHRLNVAVTIMQRCFRGYSARTKLSKWRKGETKRLSADDDEDLDIDCDLVEHFMNFREEDLSDEEMLPEDHSLLQHHKPDTTSQNPPSPNQDYPEILNSSPRHNQIQCQSQSNKEDEEIRMQTLLSYEPLSELHRSSPETDDNLRHEEGAAERIIVPEAPESSNDSDCGSIEGQATEMNEPMNDTSSHPVPPPSPRRVDSCDQPKSITKGMLAKQWNLTDPKAIDCLWQRHCRAKKQQARPLQRKREKDPSFRLLRVLKQTSRKGRHGGVVTETQSNQVEQPVEAWTIGSSGNSSRRKGRGKTKRKQVIPKSWRPPSKPEEDVASPMGDSNYRKKTTSNMVQKLRRAAAKSR